jgi:two-component system sensor histidine kinase/response regulator
VLPLAQAVQESVIEPAVSDPRPAVQPPILAGDSTQARVLLVEDNAVNQRIAAHLLTKLGCYVDIASDGVEATERLTRFHYDAVLMDCQMPQMDGFEATRIIRDPRSRVLDHDVIVIALTANAFAEDRQRCLAAGMNDFLTKPVDRAGLAAMLQKWLGTARTVPSQRAAG